MSDRVWFTSDTHWHHSGVLKYGRGEYFADVDEMNEALIQNWNECVKPGDRVYHLGDFSFGNKSAITELIIHLPGQIHMIRGNHDGQLDALSDRFVSYGDYKTVKIAGQRIVMSHYPMLTWDSAHHGSWMLHGHCHGGLAPTTQPRLDVGVDCHDFRPISFEQVRELMKGRVYEPVDHHTPKEPS